MLDNGKNTTFAILKCIKLISVKVNSATGFAVLKCIKVNSVKVNSATARAYDSFLLGQWQ